MAEAGVGTIPIRPDMAGFAQQVQREAEAGLGAVASRLQSFGRQMFRSGAIITASVSAPLALGFKAAFDAASDLNETMSQSDTIFRDQAASIQRWASTASTSFGQSRQEALSSAASFGNMFTQLGIGTGVAADMSEQMTELASDFASFHNADISEVINAQQAAFRGEYDAVQRFVPTINAAAVEQKALEMGLAATTGELDAQDKALAVQALLLEGAGDAMGDFDRTADGAANKQRILSAQFKDAAALLGQQLIPVFQKVVGWVQKGVEWFAELGQPMKNIVLISAALLAALGPVLGIIGGLVTAIGVLISPIGLVVVAIAALAAGLVYAYTHFEGFRGAVDGVVSWLTDTAWPAVETFFEGFMGLVGEVVAYVQDIWPQVSEAIGHVVAVVTEIISTFVTFAQGIWRQFGDEILSVARTAWEYVRSTIENVLNIVRGVIQTFLAVINGDWGRAWDGIKQVVAAVWDQIRNVISTQINVVKAAMSAGWDAIRGLAGSAWDGIKGVVSGGVDAVVSFVAGIPGRIGAVVSGAFDAIPRAFKAAINAVIRAWNGLRIPGFSLSIDLPGPVPDIGFSWGGLDLPNIPTLHEGGEFRAPRPGGEGLALLRDRERVFTPEQMRSGGGSFNWYQQAPIYGVDDLERTIVRALDRAEGEYAVAVGQGWRP